MTFDIVTIFPAMIEGPLAAGILGRAIDRGTLDVKVRDLRDFTTDRHRVVDDVPYGGGPGMVLKPDPIFRALDAIEAERGAPLTVVLTSPQGRRFAQDDARRLSGAEHVVVLCGRYEGVDDRVRARVTDEISIGDYVLTGGELPALVVTDAVTRLLPGVLGGEAAAERESFAAGLLEPPQYTRPEEFRGARVPDVLLSGDHARVARWRREQALWLTWRRRPELLAEASLTDEERRLIERFKHGEAPAAPARGERDEDHGRDSHR
jgi:tRNA (guanine37-N1)-methyltransferase